MAVCTTMLAPPERSGVEGARAVATSIIKSSTFKGGVDVRLKILYPVAMTGRLLFGNPFASMVLPDRLLEVVIGIEEVRKCYLTNSLLSFCVLVQGNCWIFMRGGDAVVGGTFRASCAH